MATTKRTRCQFKVKEGISVFFIDAEPCSGESHSENPGTDLLWFVLRSGISWDEAQRVANFLNDHILSIARTTFEDAKDLVREAKHDLYKQRLAENFWEAVLEKLRASLQVEDFSEALENLKRVEAWGKNLL